MDDRSLMEYLVEIQKCDTYRQVKQTDKYHTLHTISHIKILKIRVAWTVD